MYVYDLNTGAVASPGEEPADVAVEKVSVLLELVLPTYEFTFGCANGLKEEE